MPHRLPVNVPKVTASARLRAVWPDLPPGAVRAMAPWQWPRRGASGVLGLLLALCASSAPATEVGVVGLFPGKAVLVIDNAAPRTYSVGRPVALGIGLSAVDADTATLTIDGKTRVIPIGSHVNHSLPGTDASITLQANGQGHYLTQGRINGGGIQMLVDTGATLVALPAADAVRLGIDYRRGQKALVNTANGPAPIYRVTLDAITIGTLTLTQVDAAVQEAGLPFALLGMSFLSRTDMNRTGSTLTLTKRY